LAEPKLFSKPVPLIELRQLIEISRYIGIPAWELMQVPFGWIDAYAWNMEVDAEIRSLASEGRLGGIR
jgi:hypothetical protein